VSYWRTRAVSALATVSADDLPRAGQMDLDTFLLGFAVALSIATGVLVGLFPSLQVSRPDLAHGLRDSAAGASGTSGRRGVFGLSARGLLIIGQVALSMILLVGAALLLESMARLAAVDPRFQPSGMLTMRIPLPGKRYDTDQKRAVFFNELTRRVELLPGVRSAGVTLTLPMTGFAGSPVQVIGRPLLRLNQRPIAIVQSVTPDYFRTLGIPLKRGREFTDHDDASAPRVAVINERLARRFWPAYPGGENPVGQHILVGASPQPLEIVGIVGNIHQAGLESEDTWPGIYSACAQNPPHTAMMAVRTEGDLRRSSPPSATR
jgi:putative ABC transport system permease protein